MTRKYLLMITIILIGVLVSVIAGGYLFLHQTSFGRLPQGERLERILKSPNYRNGEFHNLDSTVVMTSQVNRWKVMWRFLFETPKRLRPENPVPANKISLKNLGNDCDLLIWFGHSSYLLQISGKRILVDPVFCMAAPVSFVNRPFNGTDIYHPDDMPGIDYLVISHDHWDHLDYKTVVKLKNRVGKVIVPLGVGEHFEYWGYDKQNIIELDWMENIVMEDGFNFHCLPARHFSGRGLTSNKTLWASFLVETPSLNVFMGGDGGYGSHFKQIGKLFQDKIDLAILENGQYNEDWRYIHTMPDQLRLVTNDLGASQIMTVHHSKYALARHPWDEPLKTEEHIAQEYSLKLIVPYIGEIVRLNQIVIDKNSTK